MKKIAKAMITVALVGATVLGVSACNESAYDIAVKNGFIGTETEWLDSLRGENGKDGQSVDAQALYEGWKAEGNEGSFLDFCEALNISVSSKNDTAQIAENILSVVSIYCPYTVTTDGEGWFNKTVDYGYQTGSGVIVDLNKQAGNAYIVTNYHVLYNLKSDRKGLLEDIWVYPYGAANRFSAEKGDVNGDGIKATYVGGAMDYDVAILKIEGSKYLQEREVREAKLGDSNSLRMGEETFVIGNPAGAGISVTNGIVSVPSEYISMSALDERDLDKDKEVDLLDYRVIRTSAAINGGNSGGGMFNLNGELIGIVNAKSGSTSNDNMGYALPITQVKAIYDNILANGDRVKLATLGIYVSVTGSRSVLDDDGNVVVVEEFCVTQEASAGSAAYQKLRVGDIFLSAQVEGGEKQILDRRYRLTEVLLTVRKGQKVIFTVRNASGQEKEVTVTFGEGHFATYA